MNPQSMWGLPVIPQKLFGVPRAQSVPRDAPMGQVSSVGAPGNPSSRHRASRRSPAALSFRGHLSSAFTLLGPLELGLGLLLVAHPLSQPHTSLS